MGFRRYVAPSVREALDRIRKELGAEAVILSNRRSATSGRVEIIAAAPGEMSALVDNFVPAQPAAGAREARPAAQVAPARAQARPRTPSAAPARVAPESFQEFIRRQSPASQRVDALAMYQAVASEPEAEFGPLPAAPQGRDADEAPAVFRRRPSRLVAAEAPGADMNPAQGAQGVGRMPAIAAAHAPGAASSGGGAHAAPPPATPAVATAAVPAPAPEAPAERAVMAELQSLRSALSDRLSHLEKQLVPGAAPARQESAPAAPGLKRQAMTRLIMSGFSPELARRLADAAPANLDPKEIDAWLQSSLGQQIRCPAEGENSIFQPGAAALVGPTGVGKTTTLAKLAARFVVRHGAAALGLITLDSYRMGAHEQLRGYGRILGVPMHVAHDGASLRDLLRSMQGKRKVLIDTCGISQRDPRLGETLAMLADARFNDQEISRVLLINAASHAETLDEVARAWRVSSAHGAVLTKIDEAARIGGGLDALIRFHLPLLGLTNGQRVPEDWHPGNPGLLAHIALKPFGAAFCLESSEIHSLTGAGAALV
jgi:flagellar biosynthesis protein FlhF